MKGLVWREFSPIDVSPEDTITLYADGEKILEKEIGKEMTLDTAILFLVDNGDFEGFEEGIGVAFVKKKETSEVK